VQVIKFYKKYSEKKFLNPFIEISTSRIIKLLTKNISFIEVNLLIVATPRKWVDNDDYTVSLENNDRYESDS